jgi:hypothetical protein
MERSAVVVGTDTDSSLHFSGIRLGPWPARVQHYAIKDASQGELRSHGFFYSPNPDRTGLLGLPIRGGGESGWKHLVEGSVAVLFLGNEGRDFVEAGALHSSEASEDDEEDGCIASCTDWYGNSRPIFLRNRIFALLGYELVEGRMRDGRIKAFRRIDFTPFVDD